LWGQESLPTSWGGPGRGREGRPGFPNRTPGALPGVISGNYFPVGVTFTRFTNMMLSKSRLRLLL
jgi:hypothetical protein